MLIKSETSTLIPTHMCICIFIVIIILCHLKKKITRESIFSICYRKYATRLYCIILIILKSIINYKNIL